MRARLAPDIPLLDISFVLLPLNISDSIFCQTPRLIGNSAQIVGKPDPLTCSPNGSPNPQTSLRGWHRALLGAERHGGLPLHHHPVHTHRAVL